MAEAFSQKYLEKDEQSEAKAATLNDPEQVRPILSGLKYTDSCYQQEDESVTLPRLHVMNQFYFDIYGVDAIWHNMYLGPNSDWTTMRKQCDATIEQMVQLVAKHVAEGLYGIISMNATKHSLTVICGCEKMRSDMPADMFDEPVGMKVYPWKRG